MAMPVEKNDYTFADYLEWDGEGRIELLNGEPVMMAPPSTMHQLIVAELLKQLAVYLDGKKCKVIPAPFAVRLFEEKDDAPERVRTVVQPDLSVICNTDRLDKRGYKGAPDLVIEILSPSTAVYDRLVKFNLYQRAGVQEYWIVSPEEGTVQTFLLSEDGYYRQANVGGRNDRLKVHILDDCTVDLSKVFPEAEEE